VIGGYRIDLYFVKYNLAIECDEDAHNRKTNIINDLLREESIKKEINGISFIRYKPYDRDFNIYKLLNEIFVFIKNNMT
jgi:very-short-patch-repair endonuclease